MEQNDEGGKNVQSKGILNTNNKILSKKPKISWGGVKVQEYTRHEEVENQNKPFGIINNNIFEEEKLIKNNKENYK